MKYYKQRRRLPMKLQFFAEGNGYEGGASSGDEGNGGGSGVVSFDDFLKQEGNQAEFDRRVQKAISTAQEKWKILSDEKLSESEKLAKMTKDEREKYMLQKREKELTNRESEITKRELMAEAKNTLAEKKLPQALANVLNYQDAESCKKSIEELEKAFNEAVASAVEDKLKGKDPAKKSKEDGNNDLRSEIEKVIFG